MKRFVRLLGMVLAVALLLEGAEWGLGAYSERFRNPRQASLPDDPITGRMAWADMSSTFRFDVLDSAINIRELPQKPNIYYLPLQIGVADLRKLKDKNQLVAVQESPDLAVMSVFNVGQSHAVATYTFLTPEIASQIEREGLWDKIFPREGTPYFYHQ